MGQDLSIKVNLLRINNTISGNENRDDLEHFDIESQNKF